MASSINFAKSIDVYNSFCIRHVAEQFEVHKHFIGQYETSSTIDETLSTIVADVLTSWTVYQELDVYKTVDRASNMTGNV